MVTKNKLAWSSIEKVNRDFRSYLYDYLLACEYHNLLPKNSSIVIETLRKLRNDD